MPTWSMPARSSAPALRRLPAGHCITSRRAAVPRTIALLALTGRARPGEIWEDHVEKIWLKSYPAGVPAEIDINEYASIRDVLEENCAKFGSRPAYSCMGRSITFADLNRMSMAFGAF